MREQVKPMCVSNELTARLEKIALQQHKRASDLLNDVLNKYVENYEAEQNEAQEAISSLDELRQSNVCFDGQEIINWVRSWGTDDELDTPHPCRV